MYHYCTSSLRQQRPLHRPAVLLLPPASHEGLEGDAVSVSLATDKLGRKMHKASIAMALREGNGVTMEELRSTVMGNHSEWQRGLTLCGVDAKNSAPVWATTPAANGLAVQ